MNNELQNYYKGYDYEVLVERFIRESYTISEELAVQRQRDSKPEEFKAYNDYCEACKSKARELLKIEPTAEEEIIESEEDYG